MSKINDRAKILGGKIQSLRRQQGISQEAFSKLISRTPAHLSKIERGEKSPSLELLFLIADNLHVPTSELFVSEKVKESDKLAMLRKRINALLNVTSPRKAQLIWKVAQEIHSSD